LSKLPPVSSDKIIKSLLETGLYNALIKGKGSQMEDPIWDNHIKKQINEKYTEVSFIQ